jgi:hypothetical protein
MIVWLLTVIFAIALWGYSLYRVHTKFFNFITYFKSEKARDRYEDLTEESKIYLGAIALSLGLCLVPVVNVVIGLLMIGGSYAYPAGVKAWNYLNKVGKDD